MSDSSEEIRINKYLAACGICSRREADRLIDEGRILVNGEPAVSGYKVTGNEEITFDGDVIKGPERKAYLAFYKPVGVTVSEKDEHAETLISELIDYPVRVTYAGRLDKDSEGLILLTNDGELINRLMRGANSHEKEYIVGIDREVTEEIIAAFEKGMYLKELKIKTKPAGAEKIGKRRMRVVLTQGLNRQIRRMCEACGVRVTFLKRVRVANIKLGDLSVGEYRELTKEEILELRREVKL